MESFVYSLPGGRYALSITGASWGSGAGGNTRVGVLVTFHLGEVFALRVGQFAPLLGAFIGGGWFCSR